MFNSGIVRTLFISILLIIIYLAISVHTALYAPSTIAAYLFSEAGAYEVFSPWLWFLLAAFCLFNVDIRLTTRSLTALAAVFLGLREMDFHKKLFETSFIKMNFYRSAEIPLQDKLLGFILLSIILAVFIYLLCTYIRYLRQAPTKFSLANIYLLFGVFLVGLTKVLDRLTSQLNELFDIQLLQSTSIIITTIEESTEMLLPIIFLVSVLSYRSLKQKKDPVNT